MIKGVIYSFTNYKGYGSYDVVGWRNYVDLFTDARVGKSYLFTFKYAIAGTILVNVLSLLLALGLNSNIKGKSALRGIYFVPNILGGLVVGYIFSFIFTYILPAIGSACHISFLENSILASEKYAWIAVLIVGVWQAVAMNTIIYISGLQTVPEDVYEASMLDGANKWTEFWKITFPLIMPFVSINLVLSTKNFLMVFDRIPDPGWPCAEYRVDFLSDLQKWYVRRTVRISECKCGFIFHRDRGNLCFPATVYQ